MAQQFQVSNKRMTIGTVIALAANVAIYLAASAASATWQVGMPFVIGLPIVAIATILPMALGTLIIGRLAKSKPNVVGFSSWLVLLFALAGAPGGYIASQNVPTGLALGAMHAVVGLSWFIAIRSKK